MEHAERDPNPSDAPQAETADALPSEPASAGAAEDAALAEADDEEPAGENPRMTASPDDTAVPCDA